MSPDSPERQRDQSVTPEDDQDRAAVLKSEPWLAVLGDEKTPIADSRRRANILTAGEVHRRRAHQEPTLHLRQHDEDGRLTTSVSQSEVYATGNEVGARPVEGEKAQP